MLGKYIKSLNHLKHSLPYDIAIPFIMGHFEFDPIEGEVVKIKINNKDYILLFNNKLPDGDLSFNNLLRLSDDKNISLLTLLKQKYSYFIEYHGFTKTDKVIFSRYLPFIITNETFYTDYEKFCSNNKKSLSNIFDFYGSNHTFCKLMYILCDGSSNMFLWATSNFRKRVPFYLITEILYWFTNYKSFNGKVKKGTFTAYNDTSAILKLRKELIKLRQEKRITKVFNMFNTKQKKLLKSLVLNNSQKEMVSRFETMSKEKQLNFIRKVSTMENIDDIFHQMAILTRNHFEWNRDSFLEFITNIDGLSFEIVYDVSNVIVLHINDYETVKYVTRTTNWCISKNKTYWNNYMETNNSKQYVLFNFNENEDSEYSIVGFTTKNDLSITHAHSFTNNNLIDKNNKCENQLKSYIEKTFQPIQSLLSNLSIPLDNFIKTQSLTQTCDKESILNILSKIDEYDYDIIKDENNILVFTIKSPMDIMKFTGIGQYANVMKIISLNPIKYKHLFIFDFSKNDNEKMLYTFAYDLMETEISHTLFDLNGERHHKSLYHVLFEYEIPFDIFNNQCDLIMVLRNAFNYLDVRFLKVLLSNNSIKSFLIKNKKEFKTSISDSILCSLYHHYSFDIIELLYSKGFTLGKLIDNAFVDKLLTNAVTQIGNNNILTKVPSEIDYENLFSYKIYRAEVNAYANFYLFNLIWGKENQKELMRNWVLCLNKINNVEILNYLLNCIKPYINKIVSQDKLNVIGNAIILIDNFDFLNKDINDVLTQTVLQQLPSNHYFKEILVEKEVY